MKKEKKYLKDLQKERKAIDALDYKMIRLLSLRFNHSKKISVLKKKLSLDILQNSRWEQILSDRSKKASKLKVSPAFVLKLMQLIHKESIRIQKLKVKS